MASLTQVWVKAIQTLSDRDSLSEKTQLSKKKTDSEIVSGSVDGNCSIDGNEVDSPSPVSWKMKLEIF